MVSIIKRLRSDHRHMSVLMRLIEIEIESFNDGGTVDYELVEDILRYMVNYPDLDHHPAEEIICDKLAEIDADAAAAVGHLAEAHEELALAGERFLNVVQRVLNEEAMPRDWFVTTASEYLTSLTGHMKREELVMFPSACRLLSDDDWREVEAKIKLRPDPLGTEARGQEFEALRQRIIKPLHELQETS